MTEERMPCASCGIPVPMPHEDSDPNAQICDRCYIELYSEIHED